MEEVLISLGICLAMPVLIVWLISRMRQNETNRKAEIMLKAIDNGVTVDTELFKRRRVNRMLKEKLLGRLTAACICSFLGLVIGALYLLSCRNDFFLMAGGVLLAVGLAYLVVYFTGKKMLAKEIEAEEKKFLNQE